MKKFNLKVVFGEMACDKFNDNPKTTYEKLRELGDVKKVSFNSEEERNAYIQGLEDAMGWGNIDYVKM